MTKSLIGCYPYEILKISNLTHVTNLCSLFFYEFLLEAAHLSVLSCLHVRLDTGRDASLKNLLHFSDQVDLWAGNGHREDSLEVREKDNRVIIIQLCI